MDRKEAVIVKPARLVSSPSSRLANSLKPSPMDTRTTMDSAMSTAIASDLMVAGPRRRGKYIAGAEVNRASCCGMEQTSVVRER